MISAFTPLRARSNSNASMPCAMSYRCVTIGRRSTAPDETIAIARRDVAARDDVFAEDTLAWALARDGRWDDARSAARKAVRRNTQDARLQYHAGVIAMETGDRADAVRRLQLALALNPQFHPDGAADARARLERLATTAPQR